MTSLGNNRDQDAGQGRQGGGVGFDEWWRKDETLKIVRTGVNRDASDVKEGKMGATGRGMRQHKRACDAGLHGPRGTWRAYEG